MRLELFSVPGCRACEVVRASLEALQAEPGQLDDLQVEEIDLSIDPQRGSRYGIMACPALVVDGRLEVIGAVGIRRLRKIVDRCRLQASPVAPPSPR